MVWAWVAGLGGGAFVIVSFVVSIRMLAMARRTRQIPELTLGLALLVSGALGYPAATAARVVGPDLQPPIFALSALLTLLSQPLIVFFTWRVFRPRDAWARALSIGFVATLVSAYLWQSFGPGWAAFAVRERGPWAVSEIHTLVSLGWASLESLLYFLLLKKRVALGLADPVTCDRLRLWSIAMSCSLLLSLFSSLVKLLGIPMTAVLSGLMVGPLGLALATAVWLAFLPPRSYTRWVAARAGSEV